MTLEGIVIGWLIIMMVLGIITFVVAAWVIIR